MSDKPSPRAKQRDAVIGRSLVIDHPFQCPVCSHNNVILEGKWQRRFRKEFLEGIEQGVVFQEEAFVERYTAIVCEKCNTRTEIEPDHIVDLLAENVKLQMVAAGKRGITVVQPEKEQVN